MKKRERNGVSKTCSIFLSNVSLQRYDFADFLPILKKKLFHTVGIEESSGGWREDQHVCDGQRLIDPCFFWNFLE
jgi:hypothetical protein